MKNFLKIFVIFVYFAICLLFKGNFEANIAQNCVNIYKNPNTQIEQTNFQDNSALIQNNFQEITNLQNNTRSNNSINIFNKNRCAELSYKFKQLFSNNADNYVLSFNPNYIIYTRAP